MNEFTGYKKGINLGGWLSQCKYKNEHYDTFIVEDDIKRINSWGLDHIRLPVDYNVLEDESGLPIENGYSYIDNCVDWCKKQGLNLIIDLHKTSGYSFNAQDDKERFFKDNALQERFFSLWDNLAERYGKHGHVAFELLNEVVPYNVVNEWNGIVKLAIQRIRIKAPFIKILIGGVSYNSVLTVRFLEKPYDENIIYNFHFYEPFLFTHQKASWEKKMPADLTVNYPDITEAYKKCTDYLNDDVQRGIEAMKKSLFKENSIFYKLLFKNAVEKAIENDVPLYCGEYGVIDHASIDGTLNWFKDINGVFKEYNIGRAVWTYKKMSFGLTDEHYSPILDELINYL